MKSTVIIVSLISTLAMAISPSLALAQSAPNTPIPLGIFQNNNEQNTFPVIPQYAIAYYGWQEGLQTTNVQKAWNAGTESFIELQTCGNPCGTSNSIPISNVINGTYDMYLTNFANSVKTFGHPIMLTFDHEMNGSWYPWGDTTITPTQWIQAWQHVTSLISRIAPNASWVWAPNIEQGAAAVSSYWPGIGYSNPHVNMVGLDGYYQKSFANWSNTFATSVTDVKSTSGSAYPFLVAETGVPSTDANSVAQIDDLVSGAQSAGAMALMYFDSGTKWALTSSEQSELVADTHSH